MPLSTPVLISEGFGVGDGSKTYPIPVASQIGITPGAASFTDGYPPLTRTAIGAGGIPPSGEDTNGILYMATAHLALVCSGQPYRWDSGQESAIGGYGLGAVVLNTAGDGFWLNTTDGNTTNPDAGGAGWVPAFNYGETAISTTGGTVTLTLLQSAKGVIAVTGTLSSNSTLVFPAGIQGDWILANDTTGGFTMSAQVAGGTNVVSIPQAGPNAPTIVYSNGTDLYNANVSTAGLAPINSPHLTGTPTAPTAAATSNTTQIATTAQVHAAILAAIAGLAPLASPTFSGVPTVPTAAPGTNSLQAASTAFVQAAVAPGARSLTGNGYTTLPGGVILQWGFISVGVFAPANIVFPIAFPSACFSVSANTNRNSSGSGGYNNVFSVTRTGFTAYFDQQSGASSGYWLAVGH